MALRILTFFLIISLIDQNATMDPITRNGCGQTKTCLFTPKDCDLTTSACLRGVTYRKNNDAIDFELLAKLPPLSGEGNQYAAIGFSGDDKMGNDAVTYCLYSPSTGKVIADMSYNPEKHNAPLTNRAWPETQLSGATGSYVNGTLICRFSQKIQPPSQGASQEIFPLDQPYYLLFATGNNKDQNTSVGKLNAHAFSQGDFFPVALVDRKVSLAELANVTQPGGSGWREKLFKSHGILMIFGWWLLVATAILFARYFKTMLNGRQMCGLDYWFHFHRGLNIIGVLAIATAFVCIFVAKDGVWTGRGMPEWYPHVTHAILGLTASIGAFLQPIMAIFRCDKHDSKRPIFNWIHRFIGLASWGCASAAIWLATEWFDGLTWDGRYGRAPRGLIIFYWVVLGLVVIGLEIWITVTERLKSRGVAGEEIHLKTINGRTVETTTTRPNKFGFIRGLLLLFFVLVAIAVTVALACFIALP